MTKDEIFAIDDIKKEKVEVPEWNTTLWVKTMNGHEFNQLQAVVNPTEGKVRREQFMLNLLLRTICDEKGQLIFGLEDIEKLGKKESGALRRLFAAASRVNGLGKDEVDNITKN